MCLCNGSGGIKKQYTWGIEFIPCPDTNCTFDRQENERRYGAWKQRVINELGNIFEEDNNENARMVSGM